MVCPPLQPLEKREPKRKSGGGGRGKESPWGKSQAIEALYESCQGSVFNTLAFPAHSLFLATGEVRLQFADFFFPCVDPSREGRVTLVERASRRTGRRAECAARSSWMHIISILIFSRGRSPRRVSNNHGGCGWHSGGGSVPANQRAAARGQRERETNTIDRRSGVVSL